MKRLLILLLSSLLLCGSALAAPQTYDLDAMTFDELAELNRQVQLAMWKSDGWQEVEVPMGVYEVGVDIPEGHWTITTDFVSYVLWGEEVDEYGADIPYDSLIAEAAMYEAGQSVSWELKSGTFIKVDVSGVIFTPYVTPSLGFK